MKRFSPLDHPSDIGICAYGKTKKELFENAALGMFSLMADLDRVENKSCFKINVEGSDFESLLVNWLNELIFYQDSKKFLFNGFKIEDITATRLTAEVSGEPIDPKRHSLHRPVKAATYNQLQIEKGRAKIIFDV